MSRRFGRNQRRRAREALAAAQQQVEMKAVEFTTMLEMSRLRANMAIKSAEKDRDAALARARRMAQAMQDVVDMLPPHHAAVPAQNYEMPHLEAGERWRMHLPTRVSFMNLCATTEGMHEAISLMESTVETYQLIAGTSEDPLHRCLYFRATFDDIPLGYNMTRETLAKWPRDRAVREVSGMLAEAFVRELEKRGIRQRRT